MQILKNLCTSAMIANKYSLHPHLLHFTRGNGLLDLGRNAGPFQGKNILIAVDAHSKWIKAVCTPTTSSSCVIEELRSLFARFGLPEMVVTDNGTCFVSSEFEQFLWSNGVKHTTSAPYHPASNGLAERAVQTVKRGLKKVKDGTMSARLAKVLLTYRVTPQSTTGLVPAELLLGRRPRTRLDLLKPNTAERVERKQQQLRPRVTDDGPPDMSEIPVTPTTPETGPEPELTNSDQPNVRANLTTTSDLTESSDTSDSIDTTNSTDSNIRRYPRRQRKPRERFEPGKT